MNNIFKNKLQVVYKKVLRILIETERDLIAFDFLENVYLKALHFWKLIFDVLSISNESDSSKRPFNCKKSCSITLQITRFEITSVLITFLLKDKWVV